MLIDVLAPVVFFLLYGLASFFAIVWNLSFLSFSRYAPKLLHLIAFALLLGLVPAVIIYALGNSPLSLALLMGVMLVETGLIIGFHVYPHLQLTERDRNDTAWRRVNSAIHDTRSGPLFIRFSAGALMSFPLLVGVYFSHSGLLILWAATGAVLGFVPNKRAPSEHGQGGREAPDTGNANKKNVVFCMCDDIRRDRMSVYGYDRNTTPFLDDVSDQALLFTDHISAGTRSGTSIPSLLTGVPASVHEYGRNRELKTVMEEFSDIGYHTAGINTNGHLPPDAWNDAFDYYLYLPREYILSVPIIYMTYRILDVLGIRYQPHRALQTEDTETMKEMAKEYIRDMSERSSPFFLFWGSIEAHAPYVRDTDAVTDFAADHGANLDVHDELQRDSGARRAEWHSELIRNWGYDEMVHYTDRQLSGLVSFLKNEDLLDDTTVIILSDHGELLGEHEMWGHLDLLFNPLFEVPLIVLDPDRECDEITTPVSGLDIPSLIADLAGISLSDEFVEQIFRKVSLDQLYSGSERSVLVDCYGPNIDTKNNEYLENFTDGHSITDQRMLINGEQKLFSVNGETFSFHYSDRFLQNPSQSAPATDDLHEEFERITEWIGQQQRSDQVEDAYADIEDDDVMQQLENLGYLE